MNFLRMNLQDIQKPCANSGSTRRSSTITIIENPMATTRRKLFGELKTALQDALQYERGQKIDLRVTAIPKPAKSTPPNHR